MKSIKSGNRAWLAAVLWGAALATPAVAQEIPVAIFNATTGVYAFGGVPIQNAMRMALEDANASGMLGAAKIKIFEGDTAGEKAQTLNLVNQFARRDKVMLIMGPTTSGEALGAVAAANDLQVPMLSIGSSNEIPAAGPWTFKIQASPNDIMSFLAKYVAEKSGIKKIAIIYDQTNDGYVGQKNALRDGVKAGGVQVLAEDAIQSSDSNFLALATKLSSLDVDGIFIAAPAELSANLVVQLRQAGVDPKVRILGPSTLAAQNFLKIGGKAVEGSYLVADYAASNPSALNVAFVKAYKAKYGSDPDNWAAMGYTLAQVGLQAIKNAGPNPDREKIRAALAKLNGVPVVIGTGVWTVNAARQPSYGGVLLTIKDGKFVSMQ